MKVYKLLKLSYFIQCHYASSFIAQNELHSLPPKCHLSNQLFLSLHIICLYINTDYEGYRIYPSRSVHFKEYFLCFAE